LRDRLIFETERFYMIEERERQDLPTNYVPSAVERRLYEFWEQSGYFSPDFRPNSPPFVITIPPPNVTGELHLGHALTYSIEDVLGRYKRMSGFATLILPGTDHASIAVHTKVEALLAREGTNRREIGREEFVKRARQWKETYGAQIDRQFRALGESYDWSRERFTMDPDYYRAVMTMFVRLFDEGYIYRGARVINWCPDCRTGISDIEVRPEEREDLLYFVRMPLTDGSGDIVVATVRPETMLGDVAVAVRPEDDRYKAMVGRRIQHPITGAELPIIADDFVDPEFGTGAVKITPAHDYADFEVAERHNLPMPVVITERGTMSEGLEPPYAGLTIDEARKVAVEHLEREGFMVRVEPYTHNVPLCDRSGTVIEPLLSEQWFMHMEELAKPAIDAVKDGRVKIVPDRWTRIYLDWMENIRPWNISRQLWWGQRIPIYYCANGHATASIDIPPACRECGLSELTQDPDVLDTWFSSALWPFATLGWPERTPDLERFYPTSFMNTSSQILYLWIARMIMMGIHFMGEPPFPTVLINPTILNEKGQRMSKSLGTGIDPLEIVEQYGADAARFAVLSAGSIMQQEIRISGYERAEEGRNFANKIWNASRFVLQNLRDEESSPNVSSFTPRLDLVDRWILSRTAAITSELTRDLDTYDLTVALRSIYDFFWGEFADWYIESAKLRLRADDPTDRATARAVLWSVLDRSMRLLHPYMPFVTEEVWQHLRLAVPAGALELSGLATRLSDSIMIAPWPEDVRARDAAAEHDMIVIIEVVRAIRTLRADHKVKPRARIDAQLISPNREALLKANLNTIASLAGLGKAGVVAVAPPAGISVAESAAAGVIIRVPLSQLTDIEEEIKRTQREIDRLEGELAKVRSLLGNAGFVDKAPEPVVNAEREKLVRVQAELEQRRRHLEKLIGGADEQ
jgi:valyl-tRNA synthetase